MQEVYEFIKDAKTYFLATVDGDAPRVRPFGTIYIFEGKLYIQTGKRKDVYKQIVANPKIEICASKGAEWIRVSAKAVPDERLEPQVHMLEQYPELASMYQPGDGNNVVLYLEDVTAVIASFVAPPKYIRF
ncbi:MAG: pyridoxamine 5'-phosphate oxidase family protein [Coriobacteriales bacterium]|nr:pyridoxamine 5'-phosphate oxidase family protein [Coriobacteriales bacterium]